MRAAALLQHLPHPADSERRRSRRPRAKRRAWAQGPTQAPASARAATSAQAPASTQAVTPTQTWEMSTLARVREAGGPIDNASYTCACGFVFAASVSTTVACPHCGADQAW